MIRHFKNMVELSCYASISCAFAFLVRIRPEFLYPVSILKLAILVYCIYIIFAVEGETVFCVLLCSAVLIGWLGGYWDLIELLLNFNSEEVASLTTSLLFISSVAIFVGFLWNRANGNKTSTRK